MEDHDVGALLHWWRLRREYGVRELAHAITIHHTYLSRLESGVRRLSSQLARQLDQELDTGGALVEAVAALGSARESLTGFPPNQLPPPEALVDRLQLVEHIHTALQPNGQQRSWSPTVVLTGPGGIGKSAVAAAAAYQMRERYEGVLWADLRGWDEVTGPRSPAVLLRSWCALAANSVVTDLPTELDDLVELWRSIMARRGFIIGIDNARSEQIPPLIPASPGSVILITSRDRVPDVPGQVQWVPVPPLEADDATTLVAQRSGQDRHTIARLAPRGGGLPLALRALGDYVAAHTGDEELIDQMSTDTAPPDAVRRAAQLSYQQLTDEQARTWRLCAILPDLSPESAAATMALDEGEIRSVLDAVADATLLTKRGRGWQYHELHRKYALEESQRVDSRAERDDAAERSFAFMLHGWAHASVMLAPDRSVGPPLDPPPPNVHPPRFDSYDSALKWAEAHWEYQPVAVHRAIERGWVRFAWQLVASSFAYIMLVKSYSTAYDLAAAAEALTERATELEGRAWMAQIQGYIDTERGELEQAVHHLSRSLDLRRRRGDARDIGWAAQALARARLLQGDPSSETVELLGEAIDALDSVGATSAVGSALSLRGTVYLTVGELALADADLTRAVEQLPVGGDPLLHCYAYTRLATVRLQQHRFGDAEGLARHADEYGKEHSAYYSEVDALDVLGQVLHQSGDTTGARKSWTRAIEIADYLGTPEAARIQSQLDQLDPLP